MCSRTNSCAKIPTTGLEWFIQPYVAEPQSIELISNKRHLCSITHGEMRVHPFYSFAHAHYDLTTKTTSLPDILNVVLGFFFIRRLASNRVIVVLCESLSFGIRLFAHWLQRLPLLLPVIIQRRPYKN